MVVSVSFPPLAFSGRSPNSCTISPRTIFPPWSVWNPGPPTGVAALGYGSNSLSCPNSPNCSIPSLL
jgi:hypothetical protein